MLGPAKNQLPDGADKVKRLKFFAVTLSAGLALQALSGTVVAAEPPGRSASSDALDSLRIRLTDILVSEVPLDQISLNFEKSTEPDQPGVTPGGGDITP
jgi:hypothetical protein